MGDHVALWRGGTGVTSNLPAGVTGLAIDPSGSVFVASSSGLYWIPYQSSGLDVNGEVQIASSFGSGNAAPVGVALDDSENIYTDYGATTHGGSVAVEY